MKTLTICIEDWGTSILFTTYYDEREFLSDYRIEQPQGKIFNSFIKLANKTIDKLGERRSRDILWVN
jgi:hypothetical protein